MRMVVVFALAHCDKLLGWGGVNGNGSVKVCFSCTHFDCNSETLQHLVTAQALHVQAHHLEKGHKAFFENSLQLLMFFRGKHGRLHIRTELQPVSLTPLFPRITSTNPFELLVWTIHISFRIWFTILPGGLLCKLTVFFINIAAHLRTEDSYLLLLAHTHQLHDALTLPACDGVIHWSERSLVDLHILLPSSSNGLLCDKHRKLKPVYYWPN